MESHKDRRLAAGPKVIKERGLSEINIGRDVAQRAARQAQQLCCEASIGAVVRKGAGAHELLAPREWSTLRIGHAEHDRSIPIGDAALGWPEKVGERGECGEERLDGAWGEDPNERHE